MGRAANVPSHRIGTLTKQLKPALSIRRSFGTLVANYLKNLKSDYNLRHGNDNRYQGDK